MDNQDRKFMCLAIKEARKCKPEDDRLHPKVGAVVVKDAELLASGYRGERIKPNEPKHGDHAEFTVLEKKLKKTPVAGATVYTTLEPCTTGSRKHPKIACTKRLIERRVARVVIGSLDPDRRITGRGQLELREAGIVTDLFLPEQMAEGGEDFLFLKTGMIGSKW